MLGLLLCVTLPWVCLYILYLYLETHSARELSEWMDEHNVTLSLGYIDFYTTRFNAKLELIGKRNRRFLTVWFQVGVIFGFLGMLLSTVILSANILAVVYSVPADLPSLSKYPSSLRGTGISSWIDQMEHGDRTYTMTRGKQTSIAMGSGGTGERFSLTALTDMFKDRYRHEHSRSKIPTSPMDRLNRQLRKWGTQNEENGTQEPPIHEEVSLRHSSGRSASNTGDSKSEHDDPRPYVDHQQYGSRESKRRNPLDDGDSQSVRQIFLATKAHSDEPSRFLPTVTRFTAPNARKRKRLVQYYSRRGAEALGKAEHIFQDIEKEAEAIWSRPRRGHNLLTPLLPGINLPVTDLVYIAVAFLVSIICHELGHALAAGAEDSRVMGVGGFLALIFLGAYVRLDGVPNLSTNRQLRVYCAGAWHNVIVAVFCLCWAASLPLLTSPVYSHDSGAIVISMPPDSPLAGHLRPGDTVLSLGPYQVSNGGPSFREAISKLAATNNSVGFCMSDAMRRASSLPPSNCCPQVANGTEHPYLQCFEILETDRKTCIPLSLMSGLNTCRVTSDCYSPARHRHFQNRRVASRNILSSSKGPPRSSGGSYFRTDASFRNCYVPVLPSSQQLIDMKVKNALDGAIKHYFYQGYPEILGHSVTVSSFIPRGQNLIPAKLFILLSKLDIPNKFEKLLNYIASVSLGLAILNMAPVFHLDGATSVMLFVKTAAPNLSEYRLMRWRSIILAYGTILLVLNVIISFVFS